MSEDNPYENKVLFVGDREVRITEAYAGHGKDDPPGWYYHFVDEPNIRHWVSASALPHRMKAQSFDQAMELRRVSKKLRRDDIYRAALGAATAVANQYNARLVCDDRLIKFKFVFEDGDVLEFQTCEF